ncbi:XRE family transcriptional regulator [Vagococcus carniphilus]|uniref:LexA family transcriptional regulator n=1 Tax=Vagococcus carniphilus TaxID=218144 RepID=UPI00288DD289|nr:XRE family transcriptional regulator [Vagococcus carniphilus]MDT2830060.1 XRE family transcriptional regulator [Vagococcus carniphilus]MDT2838494.1 XRE family transcriptional regulator [Vagococcus carniphilus]MDT2855656.1 XRE family transcriptional regulator [Vagococcus carniphilus]
MARKPLSEEDLQIRKIIAENLKRITHGLTQAEISDRTGIPTSTLSGYLTEKSTINKDNAEKIAAAFNIDKSDIDPRYIRNYEYYDMKKELLDELITLNKSTKVEKLNQFEKMTDKANSLGLGLSSTITDRGNKRTLISHDTHEYNFFDANIAAGVPTSVEAFDEDHNEQIAIPDLILGKHAGSSDIFFTSVNGDSMNNVIPNKSIIAVKKIESYSELADNDIVVFSNDNEFSVKRFINDTRNNRIIFRPDSMDMSFTDVVINYEEADSLVIYGKVVVYVVQT